MSSSEEQQRQAQQEGQGQGQQQGQKSAYTTMGYFRAAREWAYPALKSSAFLERGVLTPEEFVRAGDELVYRCPTWAWEGGDPARAKSYLPVDRQYLVTRNVPCRDRVAAMEGGLVCLSLAGEDGEDDCEDGEEFSNIVRQQPNDNDNLEDEFDILDGEGEVVEPEKPPPQAAAAAGEEDDDDEYADMADFEDENVIQDTDAVPASGAGTAKGSNNSAEGGEGDDDQNILKVRTYDLSLTYDKYYQTPRVYLMGQSAEGQPLSGPEMMEDVIEDYANKTVTIEAHPHVAGPHMSIHPCQHGKVMKTIVRNLSRASPLHRQDSSDSRQSGEEQQQGGEPTVEMYLFIFLKFVSSMIPTVNYDFTVDVTASTQK